MRNEPQKSSDSENNHKLSPDVKTPKLNENQVATGTEMDTEFGGNINDAKENIHEAKENLMDQEKYNEPEVGIFGSDKFEGSIDAGDVPTNTRSGDEPGQSDEREHSDGETTQVYNTTVLIFHY